MKVRTKTTTLTAREFVLNDDEALAVRLLLGMSCGHDTERVISSAIGWHKDGSTGCPIPDDCNTTQVMATLDALWTQLVRELDNE